MHTIDQLLQDLASGATTSRQLTDTALQAAETAQSQYNISISLLRDQALQQADKADADRAAGKKNGRLQGIPFMVKDNFLTLGGTTTAAVKMLQNLEAPYQATAVDRILAEGAILIAKTNLDAFAHGSSTETSAYGPTKNPADPTRVPGGSSGGSAAAVALDIVPFALGTDTGGSIRQPASFTGVVGIKPTYGLVSRYGVVAMASSTDTVGCLTHTAKDAALIMDILAGKDDRDSTTLPGKPDLAGAINKTPANLRIGVLKEWMGEGVEPDVKARIKVRVQDLQKLGHQVEEVSMPSLNLALAIYYIVVPAEISSNLSRYDGIKYGLSVKDAKTLDEVYGLSRDQGFMTENKRRILIGTYVLSSGYYDAYYKKAQTARTILINDFNKLFTTYDVLIGPVSPTTAFKIGENFSDPLKMYLADIMTVAPSLAGLPGMSVPSGADSNGLPVGLQIIGKQKDDGLLLALAAQLEANNG